MAHRFVQLGSIERVIHDVSDVSVAERHELAGVAGLGESGLPTWGLACSQSFRRELVPSHARFSTGF